MEQLDLGQPLNLRTAASLESTASFAEAISEVKRPGRKVDGSKAFLKGVGLSVWQNSADKHSNWTQFAQQRNYFGQEQYVDAFLNSNDFWNEYEHDISLAHSLGCNSFRFSFEWGRIEPQRGKMDQEAMQRYHKILDCLSRYGMEPMVTLHHFTHPVWFEELQAFEREENIPIFVEYCVAMFNEFSPRIRLWATFNEPTCFAFCGYVAGIWCPGKLMQFGMCGTVLLNLLKAHVATYTAVKQLPHGSTNLVGIVHQHCKFAPQAEGCYNFYVRPLTDWMTFWFGTSVILQFFHTGKFSWKVPVWGETLTYTDARAPSCIDWWGINYYTRVCINWRFQMCGATASEPLTDMDFPLYPQGLFNSIREASTLQVPIFITETGLADRTDQLRREFIDQHCQEVLRAIACGYDVRGLFYWTLMDNIEWHKGFEMKFGLYEWCPTKQREGSLQLREGSKMLVEHYKRLPATLDGVRAYAGSLQLQLDADSLGVGMPMHEVDSKSRLLTEEALENGDESAGPLR